MYYDYEGHAIATSTADAASGMSEHDLAQYFGYDCSSPCCLTLTDDAEYTSFRFSSESLTPYHSASSLTEYELPRWYEDEL